MKAITIHAPWAWAIAEGHKRYEIRTWQIKYRGPIAIHSGISLRSDTEAHAKFDRLGVTHPDASAYVRGAVVAIADLVAVHEYDAAARESRAMRDDPWCLGPFAWELANVRKLETPYRCRGYACIFEIPELEEALIR